MFGGIRSLCSCLPLRSFSGVADVFTRCVKGSASYFIQGKSTIYIIIKLDQKLKRIRWNFLNFKEGGEGRFKGEKVPK